MIHEHRKKQTLAIRDDFKELVREKIDLAAAPAACPGGDPTNEPNDSAEGRPRRDGSGAVPKARISGCAWTFLKTASRGHGRGGRQLVSPQKTTRGPSGPGRIAWPEYDLTLDVVRLPVKGSWP